MEQFPTLLPYTTIKDVVLETLIPWLNSSSPLSTSSFPPPQLSSIPLASEIHPGAMTAVGFTCWWRHPGCLWDGHHHGCRREIKQPSDVSSATSVKGPLRQCSVYTVITKMSENTHTFPPWLWSQFPECSPSQNEMTLSNNWVSPKRLKRWIQLKGELGSYCLHSERPRMPRVKHKVLSLLPKEPLFRDSRKKYTHVTIFSNLTRTLSVAKRNERGKNG